MKFTVASFAQQENITPIEANAILKHLAKRGFAKQSSIKTGQRGRPASIFTMKRSGKLDMGKSVAAIGNEAVVAEA